MCFSYVFDELCCFYAAAMLLVLLCIINCFYAAAMLLVLLCKHVVEEEQEI
jgi:hypothetical protein